MAACSSPDAPDCFQSTGKTVNITRNITAFNKITIDQNIDLIIQPDTFYALRVEGGENILSDIETKVQNGTLNIANKNTCNWVRSYKRKIRVYLHVKDLQTIEQSGFGSITFTDTLRTNFFAINLYGVSEVLVKVKARQVNVDVNSLGTLTLEGSSQIIYLSSDKTPHIITNNFVSREAFVKHKAGTDITLAVSDSISAEILRSGNIFYKGTDKVNAIIKGTGKIIKVK